MKRTHSGLVKFKVALAALTGEPIADICKRFEIGESLVHKWKKQLKEHGAEIFSPNISSYKHYFLKAVATKIPSIPLQNL